MHLPYGRNDGTIINPKDMLKESSPVIGTGEWDNFQCRSFKDASIGSIVFVREGNTPIALVEIISENFNDDTLQLKYYHRNYRFVKILSWASGNQPPRAGLFSQGTFKICSNSETEQYIYIESWYNHILNQRNMNTIKNILESNYNLILTGAPGTGKTFLAKQIAAQMILGKSFDENTASEEEKVKMKEQYDFVQFHPSYDYTDLMEGLRPIDNNGNISFRREDGIFMKFCRKALEAYNKAEKKEEAPKYIFVIDEINRGDLSKIFGELFFSIDPGYRGVKGKVKTQYCNLWKTEKFGDSDSFYIPENVYIIGTMNDIDRSVESMDFAMRRRFAFKEVRAEDRMEMIEESAKLAPFFAEIKERMNNLNYAILTIQGLSTAYQIGAAYFLKLENYLANDEKLETDSWKSLWDNHLYGLLFEYLRGLPNAEEDLDILYRAYTLEDKYKMENKTAIKISSQDA
jgi:5-methylcytosine-specific restriction protein B